jgi:hypothetical protein
MIVEDERATYDGNFDYSYDHLADSTAVPDAPNIDFQDFLCREGFMFVIGKFIVTFNKTWYIWERFGHENNHN